MNSPPSSSPTPSLREQAVYGVRWMTVSTGMVFTLSLTQNIVLARLLSPRDFGLVGMIWLVLGLAQLLSDAGLGNALVQMETVTPRRGSSLFWLNFTVSAALALLVWAGIPWLVQFNREPQLAELAPFAIVSFFLASVGQPLRAFAQRELRFRSLALSEILNALVGCIGSSLLAWQGMGARSMVLGSLLAAAVRTSYLLAVVRKDHLLGLAFDLHELRGLAHFGFFQLGERICNYLWSNMDYLVIGRVLGPGPLGLYRLAYETAVRPLSLINPIFNSVAYPVFARRRTEREVLRNAYLELVQVLGAITLPAMAGMAALAPELLAAIFGPKWLEAGAVLRILCLFGALRALVNPVGNILLALGQVRTGFLGNLIFTVLTAITSPLAAPHGLVAVAWTATAVTVAVTAFMWRAYLFRTIGLGPGAWLRVLFCPASLSLVMAVLVWILSAKLPPELAPGRRLALAVPFGALVYVGLYALVDRPFVAKVVRLALRR